MLGLVPEAPEDGLYVRDGKNKKWVKLEIPTREEVIKGVDAALK